MADIKSPEERSRNMSKIRSKNTNPEEYIRKKLFRLGYRYRKNTNAVYGHPDAWLAKYNTALFVHGCFWHRHEGCKYAYTPKSRVDFWQEKFQKNVERDLAVKEHLTAQGIRILIVWECTVRKMIKSEETECEVLNEVEDFLTSTRSYEEIEFASSSSKSFLLCF
ncbi:MAG: very short patch repair endonuclease [Oscillospiraceae bacterium]|nr:very short patch repair endonuclease [Oscillospiraceae bacterium]